MTSTGVARTGASGTAPAPSRRAIRIAALGTPLLLATLLRAHAVFTGRLWIDEYVMLLSALRPTAGEVVREVATSNNLPFHHLLLHAVPAFVGEPRLARILSALVGILAVGLAMLATEKRWGTGAAAVAGFLLALSPIAVHFSAEIRPYAFLPFLFLLALLATDRALERPKIPRLVAQAAANLLALGFHPNALVLLPVGAVTALLVRRSALRSQLGVLAVGVAVVAPLAVLQAARVEPGMFEYMRSFWRGRPRWEALALFAHDLSPASAWPPKSGGPFVRALELLALALLVAAAALAIRALRRGERSPETLPVALAVLLLGGAGLAATGALLDQPVVAPGRFAVAFLPAVAVLAGWSASLSRAGFRIALAAVAVSAVVVAVSLARPPRRGIRPEVLAIAALEANVARPATVYTVGLTGLPLRFHLRHRQDLAFRAWPTEVERHMSWWAPEALLAQPDRLASEASVTAAAALAESGAGRQLFLEGGDHPVAASLRSELSRSFRLRPISRWNPGLFELVPLAP